MASLIPTSARAPPASDTSTAWALPALDIASAAPSTPSTPSESDLVRDRIQATNARSATHQASAAPSSVLRERSLQQLAAVRAARAAAEAERTSAPRSDTDRDHLRRSRSSPPLRAPFAAAAPPASTPQTPISPLSPQSPSSMGSSFPASAHATSHAPRTRAVAPGKAVAWARRASASSAVRSVPGVGVFVFWKGKKRGSVSLFLLLLFSSPSNVKKIKTKKLKKKTHRRRRA